MRKALFTLALLASAFTLPLTAHADAIDRFTFNFVTPPGYLSGDLIIDLPASPPPSPFNSELCNDECFFVVGIGDGQFGSTTYILKFSPFELGTSVAFAVWGDYPFGFPPVDRAYLQFFAAEDLFTGSVSDPTFLTGTFDAEYRPFSSAPEFPGTITIEPVDTTVPEPSTFAMMATGILGAIATLRSRKTMFA
jgi:hypothetical protein